MVIFYFVVSTIHSPSHVKLKNNIQKYIEMHNYCKSINSKRHKFEFRKQWFPGTVVIGVQKVSGTSREIVDLELCFYLKKNHIIFQPLYFSTW